MTKMLKRELLVVPAVIERPPLIFHRSQLVPATPEASLISKSYPPLGVQVAAPLVTAPGELPGENFPPSVTLTSPYSPAPLARAPKLTLVVPRMRPLFTSRLPLRCS